MRISDWSSDVCSSDLKFIGDAILAVFPIDEKHGGDARKACAASMAAASQALAKVERTAAACKSAGKPLFRCGIALHVGHVMYGNIGAADRLDFTVIGPAVNLVSPLATLNRLIAVPLVDRQSPTLNSSHQCPPCMPAFDL